jgi:hypothetical protein
MFCFFSLVLTSSVAYRQLNELIQVFIHHHIPLIQIRKVFLLDLESAVGYIESSEMSLQFIPGIKGIF